MLPAPLGDRAYFATMSASGGEVVPGGAPGTRCGLDHATPGGTGDRLREVGRSRGDPYLAVRGARQSDLRGGGCRAVAAMSQPEADFGEPLRGRGQGDQGGTAYRGESAWPSTGCVRSR